MRTKRSLSAVVGGLAAILVSAQTLLAPAPASASTGGDTTAPTITMVAPAQGATYFRGQVVRVEFTCADEPGGSGVRTCAAALGQGEPLDTSTLGSRTFELYTDDNAGNGQSVFIGYSIVFDSSDTTAPTISVASPAQGRVYALGQHALSDFSCADGDGGSGVRTCVADIAQGQAIDTSTVGPRVIDYFADDHADNTASASVSYTVVDDTTAPTITVASPLHGGTYSRGQRVLADFTCADEDGGTGVKTCAASIALGEPIDTSTVGSKTLELLAVDNGDNARSEFISYTVIDDTTGPEITITIGSSPTDGSPCSDPFCSTPPPPVFARGERVVARFSCTDSGSGLTDCSGPVAVGAALDTDTEGRKTFTVVAADRAGNLSSKSFDYDVSSRVEAGRTRIAVLSPRYAECDGPFCSHHGRGQVTNAEYYCFDEDSGGVASCVGTVANGTPFDTSTSGPKTFTVTATYNNGEQFDHSMTYLVTDTVEPSVSIAAPLDGASFLKGQAVTASYTCADDEGGSGLDSCIGNVASGAAIDTATTGTKTFTVTATDNDRNTATSTVTYTVVGVPVLTAAPRITGTKTVGSALSVTDGTWSPAPTGFAYQWQRCSSAGARCVNVGVNQRTYELVADDSGKRIRALVTATNDAGSASRATTLTTTIGAPVRTGAPQIHGTKAVGSTLTVTNGTWSPAADSYAYQWLRCNSSGAACVNIGAGQHTYQLVPDDSGTRIRAAVTAINGAGSAATTTGPTTAIGVPVATATPLITGRTVAGSTLSVGRGSWSPAGDTYAYQWLRCDSRGAACVEVGTDQDTYELGEADTAMRMRARVTAITEAGSASRTTTATVAVGAPMAAATPLMAGRPVAGSTLSVGQGSWSPAGDTYTYQWLRCDSRGAGCVEVGTDQDTYVLVDADTAKRIRARVTATNAAGFASRTTGPTATVGAPIATSTPLISGHPVVGSTLSVGHGSWSPAADTYAYRWLRCNSTGRACVNVGSGENTYRVVDADTGKRIRATVSATNTAGSAATATSVTAAVTAT